MKLIKPIFVSAFATLILSSCSPTLAPMVSTNPANIDKFPIKTTPIKEEDLKRWSHLDIYKDTIPGMSVDRAYSELLKGKKSTKVVVGVIDSGVDIDHEDLKGKISEYTSISRILLPINWLYCEPKSKMMIPLFILFN